MKTKKMLLIVIIAAALGVGWLLSVRTASSTEVIKEQRNLVKEADELAARKLYVRAIDLYEEALSQSSRLTPEIQAKLLVAYQGYEDMNAYAKLVENRNLAGTATEEEYLTAAEYYAGRSKWSEAVTLLKVGVEKTGSQTLTDYLEEIRYPYKTRVTRYQQILPSADNSQMPAFDGVKWGYIDEGGSDVLDFIYDSATPYGSAGFAVVSIDGTYYAILSNGDWYVADDGTTYDRMTDILGVSGKRILGKRGNTYSYYDYDFAPIAESYQFDQMSGNACGVAAVSKGGKWGIIKDSGETVVDYILEDVAVNSLGNAFAGDRAMVKENGVWYLIDTEGNHISENTYADAKAPESSGYIAVADADGNWGYIDREGNQVIDYQYNDAKSFSNHLGAVKSVNDWGYISEKNKMIIEENYEDAQPFHNGIAQAKLTDGMALLTLKYFEE